jgi:hypothetical protein
MLPVGFEPTIPASARPQTYALDRAATGIGLESYACLIKHNSMMTLWGGGGVILAGFVIKRFFIYYCKL